MFQQHGNVVDSLPIGSDETVAIFVDYLSSETRIQIPSRWSTDLGIRIEPPEGVTVWMSMSPHDAKVFHSHLSKRKLVGVQDSTRLFTAYDRRFQQCPELCSATLSFFAHLKNHITSGNDRLIVVTIKEFDS